MLRSGPPSRARRPVLAVRPHSSHDSVSPPHHDLSRGPSLYPGHYRLSPLQRGLMAVGSSLLAIANPERGDMVAVFGETTAMGSLRYMKEQMEKSEEGRLILQDKPRVHEKQLDLHALASLPEDTLGGAYARYMLSHNFVPSERTPVRFIDDPDLAYVMTRYREVHDFVHAITGMKPTIIGELAVKWLEWTQTGLPMCGFSSLVGPLKLSFADQRRLFGVLVPWAVQCGRSADSLLSIYYEHHLEEKIADLQRRHKIIPAPFVA